MCFGIRGSESHLLRIKTKSSLVKFFMRIFFDACVCVYKVVILVFIGKKLTKMEKKKVMIVEDDNVLSQAMSLSLKNDDYELIVATDGGEAERLIQQEVPDLVFLDLLLPVKNGFEVLKIVRQNPITKDIPVVVLSNYDEVSSTDEAKKLGVKEYIVKANMGIDDLPKIVRKYLPV